MKTKDEKHFHTVTAVKVKAKAGLFSCLFFCSRKTDTEIEEPQAVVDTVPAPDIIAPNKV